MRGAGFKIGRVFGIPIYLHSSWFLIFALITYQFGSEFSSTNPNWTAGQGWSLGLLTSALFFGSVLFHELSHSVVAIRYRLPVSSITLFFFGGVARISREPDRPGQEFLMAAAGPVSSYFLAACFWLLAFYAPQHSMAAELGGQLPGGGTELGPTLLLGKKACERVRELGDVHRIVEGSKVAGMGDPGLSAQPRASGQACSPAPEGLLAIPRS